MSPRNRTAVTRRAPRKRSFPLVQLKMRRGILLFFACFHTLSVFSMDTEIVRFTIDTKKAVAEVDERFLSFTFDSSGWRGFDLDGKDDKENGRYGETLDTLISALKPAILRVGGTQEDYDIYSDFGSGSQNCSTVPTPPMSDYRCEEVNPTQWSALLAFVQRNGLDLVYGLNDMYDRPTKPSPDRGLCGIDACFDCNLSNAEALLRWTYSRDTLAGRESIVGFELGNELNIVLNGTVGSRTQAKDGRNLRDTIRQYNETLLVLGPDTHSSALYKSSGVDWLKDYASAAGDAIDALTFHQYCLGNGKTLDPTDLPASFLNASALNACGDSVDTLANILKDTKSTAAMWAGETAAANNGGKPGVTDTFIDGFWFLDQLLQMSRRNVQIHFRQAFLAGLGYPLVELRANVSRRVPFTETFKSVPFRRRNVLMQRRPSFDPSLSATVSGEIPYPLPDYYVALAFKKLMGRRVLNVSSSSDGNVRLYAHCSKVDGESGVVVSYLNLNQNRTVKMRLPEPLDTAPFRYEYIFSAGAPIEGAVNGLQSQEILLNGNLLVFQRDPKPHLPEIEGLKVSQNSTVVIVNLPAGTFGFLEFRSIRGGRLIEACLPKK